MHAIEKAMAKAAVLKSVKAGEIAELQIDVAMFHDRCGPKTLELIEKHGLADQSFVRPESVLAFFDHDAPATKQNSATRQKQWRDFAIKKGVTKLYEAGNGISHILMCEDGFFLPGGIVVGGDSHICTGGALGAVATGIGETELAAVLMTGRLWFRVPNITKIVLSATTSSLPHPKDVTLKLLQMFGSGSFIYTGIEFAGSYIDALSVEERTVISSMSIELGAKFGYVQPDNRTFEYLRLHAPDAKWECFETDHDYEYSQIIKVDLDNLPYMLAPPHNFDAIVSLKDVESAKIDQAVIGTCSGGLLYDMKIAADIVRGRKVAPHARLIVTPASRDIQLQAIKEGWATDIIAAGGIFNPARCGPCGSSHDGILAPGENCVTNGNRNFRGRMGSHDSSLYLASTAVVAASAIAGRIATPEEVM